ncbi:MAG: hypothetical protein RLZZ29_1148 [Cyanobacteriota bacterium]
MVMNQTIIFGLKFGIVEQNSQALHLSKERE